MNPSINRIKGVVKEQLGALGVTVQRRSTSDAIRERARMGDLYPHAISELEAVWRHRLLQGLPERDGRVELMSQQRGTQPTESIHLLHWLEQCHDLNGVVCEMGCASGSTSALIANEIRDDDRELWLFDSFRGLSKPTPEDELIDDIFDRGSMDAYEGTMAYPETEVRRRLAEIDFPERRIHTVGGFAPESLNAPGLPSRVAFAYVDFDLYVPIRAGLEWIHDRLTPGGIVMVDDYGWFSSGAQKAVDEFIDQHADQYEIRRVEPWVGHFIGLVRQA